tara:strand:+ start:270 stop:464 length:195 start_codon:yes stop_codon:yes gene_type:complete
MNKHINKPITAKQVSELVGVSPQQIYMQVKLGKLPHFRVGNAIRFPANIIETHLFRDIKNENEV